jgi:hypothetical protein
MNTRRLGAMIRVLPFLLAVPGFALGQPVAPPTRAEATAALNPAPAALGSAQLDQMLAPIALYPDQLLLELLMASTFPQQVIDAGQWLQDANNAALSGDELVAALHPLPWDASVKALVAFPQIIKMMNDHLDWTEALGTAFANQQVAMMARVQFLRQRSVAAGKLASTPQLRVEPQDGDITIEPVDQAMIYVPVYNPAEAYGQWPDSDAPPIYIPPPPDFAAGAIGAGIGFGVGIAVAAPLWGWGHPDWRRHEVVVDRGRYERITGPTNIAPNQVRVDNQGWHRTAPVVRVPEAQRPPPAAASAPHPPGTVGSTAVALPKAAAPALPPRAAGGPPPAAPPHPAAGAPQPVAPPHPAAGAPSPAAPPHPAAAAPQQAAPPHPAAAAPQQAAPPHPAAAAPQQAAPPHPTEVVRPPAPPHPAAAPPQQVAPPHPAAMAPQPAPPPPQQVAPPHPAAAAPQPAPPPQPAVVHPPVAPPPPAVVARPPIAPPHPAAAVPQQAAPPHPAAAAPQPAAAPPPKRPPPKPGEEEKGQQR